MSQSVVLRTTTVKIQRMIKILCISSGWSQKKAPRLLGWVIRRQQQSFGRFGPCVQHEWNASPRDRLGIGSVSIQLADWMVLVPSRAGNRDVYGVSGPDDLSIDFRRQDVRFIRIKT